MPSPFRRFKLQLRRLDDRLTPATFIWDGGGTTFNWSEGANWVGDAAPTAADPALIIVFNTADSSNLDIVGLSLDQLRFDPGAGIDLTLTQAVALDGTAAAPQIVDATGRNSIAGPADLAFAGPAATVSVTAATGQLDLTARLVGTGGLVKTGGGTLRIAGTVVNVFTGTTAVADGTLVLDNGAPNGAVSSTVVVGDNAGGPGSATLRLAQGEVIPNNGTITVNGDGLLVLGDNVLELVSGLTLGSSIGGGRVALGNGATLSVQNGVVSSVPAPSASEIGGNGTLERTAATTFNVADGAADTDLLIAVPIGAALGQGVIKNGAGTLTFSANSAITGTTTVNAGTLQVTGSIGSSPVALNGGTLRGTGAVGALNVSGGVLLPGAGMGAASALSSGSATLQGGTFTPRIDEAGGIGDALNVTGGVTISGTLLAPVVVGTPVAGQTFTVVRNDGAEAVIGTFAGLPDGATFTAGGQRFTVNYQGGDGNDVTITAVGPTVSGSLLAGGAATGAATLYESSSGRFIQSGDPRNFFGANISVRTATADINGDGTLDLIGATGPGTPGRVVVIDGRTGARLADFLPFGPGFTGGLQISAGDLTGDNFAELVVSPDATGRPRVLIYNGMVLTGGTSAPPVQADFIGIAELNGAPEPTFQGGARTAIGDVTGDGRNDLAVAAGFGGGPRITIWDGTSFTVNPAGVPTANPIANLFVFESRQRGGAWIALAELTGDNRADIISGGGPLGGPRVRVVDSAVLFALPNGTLQAVDLDVEVDQRGNSALVPYNYFADDENARGGVRVGSSDSDGDGVADFLLTGTGENLPSRIDVVSRANLLAVRGQNGRRPATSQSFDPFGGILADGVFVG